MGMNIIQNIGSKVVNSTFGLKGIFVLYKVFLCCIVNLHRRASDIKGIFAL